MRDAVVIAVSNGHVWIVRDNVSLCKKCNLPREEDDPDHPCQYANGGGQPIRRLSFQVEVSDHEFLNALKIISPRQYEALRMSLEGIHYNDIAKHQGTNPKTARTRIFRARNRIRMWKSTRNQMRK